MVTRSRHSRKLLRRPKRRRSRSTEADRQFVVGVLQSVDAGTQIGPQEAGEHQHHGQAGYDQQVIGIEPGEQAAALTVVVVRKTAALRAVVGRGEIEFTSRRSRRTATTFVGRALLVRPAIRLLTALAVVGKFGVRDTSAIRTELQIGQRIVA